VDDLDITKLLSPPDERLHQALGLRTTGMDINPVTGAND
jgi:hypothetical protein